MKRGFFKFFSLLFSVLLIMSLFAGCGSNSEINDTYKTENTINAEVTGDFGELSADSTKNEDIKKGRKIIENYDFSVQTLKFDDFIKKVNSEVNKNGGYIESSEISGREIYYSDDFQKTANIEIRIPVSKGRSFSEFIKSNSTVTNESLSTEDVTLTYVDIESRINTLTAEKEALEKILLNAKTTSDVISVREKLSKTISDLESYKSQLKKYDNLIDFCTIKLQVTEVKEIIEKKEGIFTEIGRRLKENFVGAWNIIIRFFVNLIVSIPYLILLAFVPSIVILIIFISKKKKRGKK